MNGDSEHEVLGDSEQGIVLKSLFMTVSKDSIELTNIKLKI